MTETPFDRAQVGLSTTHPVTALTGNHLRYPASTRWVGATLILHADARWEVTERSSHFVYVIADGRVRFWEAVRNGATLEVGDIVEYHGMTIGVRPSGIYQPPPHDPERVGAALDRLNRTVTSIREDYGITEDELSRLLGGA